MGNLPRRARRPSRSGKVRRGEGGGERLGRVEGAEDASATPVEDMGVDHGGADVLVA